MVHMASRHTSSPIGTGAWQAIGSGANCLPSTQSWATLTNRLSMAWVDKCFKELEGVCNFLLTLVKPM